jgi:hypothetical protein
VCAELTGGSPENLVEVVLYWKNQRVQNTMFVVIQEFMIKDWKHPATSQRGTMTPLLPKSACSIKTSWGNTIRVESWVKKT